MCTYNTKREGEGGGATELGRSWVYIDDTGRERCVGGHLSAPWSSSATHSQATIEQGGWVECFVPVQGGQGEGGGGSIASSITYCDCCCCCCCCCQVDAARKRVLNNKPRTALSNCQWTAVQSSSARYIKSKRREEEWEQDQYKTTDAFPTVLFYSRLPLPSQSVCLFRSDKRMMKMRSAVIRYAVQLRAHRLPTKKEDDDEMS